jgi:hypothetical protein
MAQGRQAAELGQVNRGTGNIAKLRPLVSSGGNRLLGNNSHRAARQSLRLAVVVSTEISLDLHLAG